MKKHISAEMNPRYLNAPYEQSVLDTHGKNLVMPLGHMPFRFETADGHDLLNPKKTAVPYFWVKWADGTEGESW